MNMPGIEFLRDRKGRQKAVMIDLRKHKRFGKISTMHISRTLAAGSGVNPSLP